MRLVLRDSMLNSKLSSFSLNSVSQHVLAGEKKGKSLFLYFLSMGLVVQNRTIWVRHAMNSSYCMGPFARLHTKQHGTTLLLV